MAAWTRTVDGWRLGFEEADGAGPSLPRLEIHEANATWVVCVLAPRAGRARTGAAWSLEEAQRVALLEARNFLGPDYLPRLDALLSERRGATWSWPRWE